MKILKLGSKGPIVRRWQTFLRGQGFLVMTTGTFDAATKKGTKAFQSQHDLLSDGIVGNQTFGLAMLLGFEAVDFLTDPASGFPKEPKFPPLTSTAERQTLFGKFQFKAAPEPGNPEAIRILGDWEAENIRLFSLPQLAGIKGASKTGRLRFHRLAVAQLEGLWAEWEERGLLDRVLTWGGAFNPRFIRGSQTVLSNHAFGTAFDINVAWNPLGAEPAFLDEEGSVFELVPIAHKWGFYWGGHFSRRDGMHFEIAKLLP